VSKYVVAIVAGLVVAFTVSFGLSRLMTAMGGGGSHAPLVLGIIAGVLTIYILANLAGDGPDPGRRDDHGRDDEGRPGGGADLDRDRGPDRRVRAIAFQGEVLQFEGQQVRPRGDAHGRYGIGLARQLPRGLVEVVQV
jgi:hypothetical protein